MKPFAEVGGIGAASADCRARCGRLVREVGRTITLWLAIAAGGTGLGAEDTFFRVPLQDLKWSTTVSPGDRPVRRAGLPAPELFQPYVVIEGDGEAYVTGNDPRARGWNPHSGDGVLVIRVAGRRDVAGRLFIPGEPTAGRFEIPTSQADPAARSAFLHARLAHYRALWGAGIPGGAWFRHQAQAAAVEAGTNLLREPIPASRAGSRGGITLESTFELFSGGRALSENLQLERALPLTEPGGEAVAITNLAGITVREMNWKPLLAPARPEPDPLAALIPADQHALFFPSFPAMTSLLDEAEALGTPVLNWLEPRSEDARVRERYEAQLCLGLNELSRLLGPSVIASLAFTGSDPYLRVGSDVAVLFEARNAALLRAHIAGRHAAVRAARPEVRATDGLLDGVGYSAVVSPDRSVCSYVAAVSNVVLVTNSREQLGILVRTALGRLPALGAQDEYVYFRQRYPRGPAEETAFLVVSDAAIRRWCSPRWRIADSRRTQGAAVMAGLQADHLDALVRGTVKPGGVTSTIAGPDHGSLSLTGDGIVSTTFGTLEFMTPIVELALDTVTRAEAEAYQRWREGYQRNWSQYFDPIAVRFSKTGRGLGADVTVMPLILASEYNMLASLGSGMAIKPGAGDPHSNSLARLVLAVNSKSSMMGNLGSFISSMAPGTRPDPMGWLGEAITLYVDDDPYWDRLSAATNAAEFLGNSPRGFPVALHCGVKSALGVAVFLSAVRVFVEQNAPGMTTWQNSDYNGRTYVKVSDNQPNQPFVPDVTLYYFVDPEGLTLTLSEPLIRRVIDRVVLRGTNPPIPFAGTKPWLGSNACLQVESGFIRVLEALFKSGNDSRQQQLSWSNLPILNEWKRRFPDQDPVRLHEAIWGTALVCPGGGRYVWNERWQTMESTALGHPGEPGTVKSTPLSRVDAANFGLTFENQGVSARVRIQLKSAGR